VLAGEGWANLHPALRQPIPYLHLGKGSESGLSSFSIEAVDVGFAASRLLDSKCEEFELIDVDVDVSRSAMVNVGKVGSDTMISKESASEGATTLAGDEMVASCEASCIIAARADEVFGVRSTLCRCGKMELEAKVEVLMKSLAVIRADFWEGNEAGDAAAARGGIPAVLNSLDATSADGAETVPCWICW